MKTIQELDQEIHQVKTKMHEMLSERESLQHNLTSIKVSLSEGILPKHLYKKYMQARAEYKNDLNKIIQEYRVLKLKFQKLNDEKTILMIQLDNEKVHEVKEKIEVLKSKYFEFYKDKTRIASMRKMANEFIIELDKIARTI